MSLATNPVAERRHPRYRTRLPLSYGSAEPTRRGFADTISEGGLYIKTNQTIKVGTRLVLQIELPRRTVTLQGEVAWAIQVPEHLSDRLVHGIGVSFIDAGPRWQAVFREWNQGLGSAGD